jgi:hypothetical protein
MNFLVCLSCLLKSSREIIYMLLVETDIRHVTLQCMKHKLAVFGKRCQLFGYIWCLHKGEKLHVVVKPQKVAISKTCFSYSLRISLLLVFISGWVSIDVRQCARIICVYVVSYFFGIYVAAISQRWWLVISFRWCFWICSMFGFASIPTF